MQLVLADNILARRGFTMAPADANNLVAATT